MRRGQEHGFRIQHRYIKWTVAPAMLATMATLRTHYNIQWVGRPAIACCTIGNATVTIPYRQSSSALFFCAFWRLFFYRFRHLWQPVITAEEPHMVRRCASRHRETCLDRRVFDGPLWLRSLGLKLELALVAWRSSQQWIWWLLVHSHTQKYRKFQNIPTSSTKKGRVVPQVKLIQIKQIFLNIKNQN